MNCSEDMLMARLREATNNSAQTVLSVSERNQVPIFIAVSIFVVVERDRRIPRVVNRWKLNCPCTNHKGVRWGRDIATHIHFLRG